MLGKTKTGHRETKITNIKATLTLFCEVSLATGVVRLECQHVEQAYIAGCWLKYSNSFGVIQHADLSYYHRYPFPIQLILLLPIFLDIWLR